MLWLLLETGTEATAAGWDVSAPVLLSQTADSGGRLAARRFFRYTVSRRLETGSLLVGRVEGVVLQASRALESAVASGHFGRVLSMLGLFADYAYTCYNSRQYIGPL